jgi:hypothetical protein
MKINHSYWVEFRARHNHRYEEYEPGIGTLDYKDRIEPQLHTVWEKLNENIQSRQAVITLNRPDFPACLISIQFQIQGTTLYVTCNFRSQATEYVQKDSRMILYWTTSILNKLDHLITTVRISCNVGHYHTLAERK